jgi:YD repeat-containing protein
MTRRKYFWALIAAVLFLAAAAQFWWNHSLAQVTVVTGEKQVAPYQDMMEARLFNVQPDGTLRLTYRLNDDPELRAAGFECILVHEIETSPERTSRSQWALPFTESFVAPCDLADLQWRMPNGSTVVFKHARRAQTSFYQGAETWELKKLGPLAYNIYNQWGDRFIYENGSLAEIATKTGRHYRVAARGGLITRVTEVGGPGSGRILFSAEFDDFGRCTQVQFARWPAERFDWDAQGFLQSWRSGSESRLSFQYEDGLLVRVTGPGNAVFPITWAENREYVNYAVISGEPVYVKSAGGRNYILSYSSRGLTIAIKCPDERQDSITIRNFVTHMITQEFGGQTWRFHFPDVEGLVRSNKVEIIGPTR